MRPLKLVLEGFTGVRDGMKRDRLELDLEALPVGLIALKGPNGAGKSTIMDNLHPYRIMPSRSARLSVDAFSYWDHLCAPQALKEFHWEHGGARYRSTFAFRKPGKTGKAEYFLATRDDAGNWMAYTAPDGTVADGKAESYDRCVEAISGSLESFFTSAFSAQNRRPLASYGASEIKGLLADLLQIDHLRALSGKAAEVAKALGSGLMQVQAELQAFGAKREQRNVLEASIAGLTVDLSHCRTVRSQTVITLEKAAQVRATLTARQAANSAVEARLRELRGRRGELVTSLTEVTQQRNASESAFRQRSYSLAQIIERHAITLRQKEHILGAQRLRDTALADVTSAEQSIAALQAELADFDVKRVRHAALTSQVSSLASSGKSQATLVKQLEEQAGVIGTVPCQGHVMQARCPLLAQAHQAAAKADEQRVSLADLRKTYLDVKNEVDILSPVIAQFIAKQTDLQAATQALVRSRQALQQASDLHAKRSLLEEAERASIEARNELETLTSAKAAVNTRADEETKRLQAAVAAVDVELQRIAAVDVSGEIAKVDGELAVGREALTAVDARIETLIRSLVTRETERDALLKELQGVEASEAQAARISEEIAHWKLLAKGLGNDGVIALTIDDAGPALTKLANDLLLECYGHRFTVDIRTQRALANGDLREGFEILVHDAHSEESKPVTMMSGGEKVWINECLVRGIALYLAGNAGQPYRTLFSDETDGPLDPERKVQFIRMKRAVLRAGGYEREFFISQTPDLLAEADATIDVALLAA